MTNDKSREQPDALYLPFIIDHLSFIILKKLLTLPRFCPMREGPLARQWPFLSALPLLSLCLPTPANRANNGARWAALGAAWQPRIQKGSCRRLEGRGIRQSVGSCRDSRMGAQ